MARQWGAHAAAASGALLLLRGGWLLASPVPAYTDAPGFALTAGGALLGLLAAILYSRAATGPRGWHWWIPGGYLGIGLAALVLAYKDSFWWEWPLLGPFKLVEHVALHLLIAPWEVFFGFVIGFRDPFAPAYVVACLAFALLVAEVLRRRTWPREKEENETLAVD